MKDLEALLLEKIYKEIKDGKVKLNHLKEEISTKLYEKILDLFIKDAVYHYKTFIHEDLKSELMVATASNLDIDEDMRMVLDYEGNPDRAYVRDILIEFPEKRLLWFIVDDPDMLEIEDLEEDEVLESALLWDDNYSVVKKVAETNDLYILPYEVKSLTIRDHEDNHWKNLIKFVEKRIHSPDEYLYETNESGEPYEEAYGDY